MSTVIEEAFASDISGASLTNDALAALVISFEMFMSYSDYVACRESGDLRNKTIPLTIALTKFTNVSNKISAISLVNGFQATTRAS